MGKRKQVRNGDDGDVAMDDAKTRVGDENDSDQVRIDRILQAFRSSNSFSRRPTW